jgi:hypothetical protein
MVVSTTDLCLNLNGLPRNSYDIISPALTRLILVNSGIVYKVFKGKGLAEDDLSIVNLKHRKKGNCTYNLI